MAVNRRRFLQLGAASAAAVAAGASLTGAARFPAPRWRGADPFGLGVASGDPTPDGVVLWTRLAPDPLAPDGHGGMFAAPVTVDYEVSRDEGFRDVVRRGSAVADRSLAHTVHPEITGLAPDRWYFYRFRAGAAISPIGRTRTAPAAGAPTDRLRFAFASCQSWSAGYYTAYNHMAAEDLDLVLHLGDYIYETGWRRGRVGMTMGMDADEDYDLRDYRLSYAQYKSEAPLRAAHAAFPWIVTMDDHEIDNNWAGNSPGLGLDIYRIPPLFRRRRAAALRAMYEHQPLRLAQLPHGPDMRLHRRYRFGDLAEITMLDTRQYRTAQACGDAPAADCPARRAGDRTILGGAQRDWLIDGFADSAARWQVIGNQVALGQLDNDPGPGLRVSTDAWDGYLADRDAVLGAAAARGVRNLVVLTGDRHHTIAGDLHRDPADPGSPVIGTEFIGTSITTGGDGAEMTDTGRTLLAANPALKYFDGRRGYVRVSVDHRLWRSDLRVVPYISRPGAPVTTAATFVVDDDKPGIERD
ncbi:alkaline phosphatase D family protein [Skermania piniformis]|uniref:Alkaline phosphatase D family protein n=1 Tax=Skermania pinensis TaxID=39122 RepID=A0ABX8SA54_9ACTN|nr:alkaline phosphatase D family protein [Skermania piniformis]QXQ14729.1 alkaline phosphatase D family protein [Skermania piniformis]